MTNTLLLPELREMLAKNDAAEMREFCGAMHPARTAEFMEGLSPAESWDVLRHAEPGRRAEIFLYFEREKQVAIIETIDRAETAAFLADLPADESVDILKQVRHEIVEELLPLIPAEERRDIYRLHAYPEGTAGAMMTTEFARLREDHTVSEALAELRRQVEELETIYYLYVVDDQDHLRGLVSLRELVLGKPHVRIGDIMQRSVVSVDAMEDQEQVARTLARFDFLALPVVDREHHMLGIVTHDDVIDVVVEEATEDAQRIAGVTPLEAGYLETGILTLTRKRGVWLTVLFFAQLITARTLGYYESVLATLPWIMLFIPLINSSGGNSGNQSATLVITGLSTGNVRLADWLHVLWREIVTGLLLGGFLALIGSLAAWVLVPNQPAMRTVPIALLLVVTCGTMLGSMLPLVFRRLGLDPALMSNPMVAGLMDILGIAIYVEVTLLLVGRLVP